MPCRSLTWLALAIVAAAAAGVAQRPPAERREPTFVNVVGADRAALPFAAVTFVGCVPEFDGGPIDRVEAVADARGRVTVKLRADLCYAAWAVGQGAAAGESPGAAAVSSVEGFFAAGAMLELRCDEVLEPRRVRIEGLEAWQAHGPFALSVLGWNRAADFEVPVVDGVFTLPPSPLCKPVQIGVLCLELRDGAGAPLLWSQGLDDPLVVPPPQTVELVAVDEHDKPLAGVTMRQRVGQLQPWRLDGYGGATRNRFRELGRTDAQGRLRVLVPYAEPPLASPGVGELLFFADAPGRAQVVGGVRQRAIYVQDRRVSEWQGDALQFKLVKCAPLAGKWRPVPAGTIAQLQTVAKLWSSDNGFMHDHRSWAVPVDPSGAFSFAGVPLDLNSARVSLWHPQGSLLAPLVPAESARRLPATFAPGEAAAPLTEVSVQVRDAHGGPARGGVLQVGPGNRSGTQLRYSIARVPLDTAGTARMLVPPGPIALLAATAHGFVGQLLVVPERSIDCELQLQPFARMPVRLLDAADRPVADATARVMRASMRGSSDPVQGLILGMESHVRWRMSQLRTGADGRLSIPFVPCEGISLHVALRCEQGTTPSFELEAIDAELEVRLQ